MRYIDNTMFIHPYIYHLAKAAMHLNEANRLQKILDEAIPLEIGMYVFADKWYEFGNKLYRPRYNFQVTEAMMPDRMHVVLEE